MALRQHRETVVVPAGRGTIVDRNGEPLAIGKLATTVYANPRQVNRPRDLTLAAAKQLRLDPAALYPNLVDRSRGFVYVARKADPHKADNLKALDFAGRRLLPGGASLLPAGPRRLAGARLRRARQQGPRGSRALSRRDAVRPSRKPDDREGPVRPCARRRRDEAARCRARTSASRSTATSSRTRRTCCRRRCVAGERARRPRSSWIRTLGRSWRWRARRRSTTTGSPRRELIAAETVPSRTPTSRGRPSSSSPSRRRSRTRSSLRVRRSGSRRRSRWRTA